MYKVPLLVLVLLLSLYPRASHAQTVNASITGRASKAAIADAKVAAINIVTNFRYETATNGAGEYTSANLAPGMYRLELQNPDSRSSCGRTLPCTSRMPWPSIFNFRLAPPSTSLWVQAGAPLVNTTLATVSTVVAQTFVEHMSLNGRSCQTLIMLETHMVVTQTAFKHQEPELGRWLPDCSMFAAEE